jgi:hypothetical protein
LEESVEAEIAGGSRIITAILGVVETIMGKSPIFQSCASSAPRLSPGFSALETEAMTSAPRPGNAVEIV